jgi:hypothetical protein
VSDHLIDASSKTPIQATALMVEEAIRMARHLRDDMPRGDPKARHLSLSITKLEEALLWLRAEKAGLDP